jgi:hypothetical protein
MGIIPRQLLCEKGTSYAELGLASPHWTDAQPRVSQLTRRRWQDLSLDMLLAA